MSVIGKRVPLEIEAPKPTLEDRLLAHTLQGNNARQDFLIAAVELESAASQLDSLAFDTQVELDRLSGILEAAVEDSDRNRRIAKNLRNLVEAEADLTLF